MKTKTQFAKFLDKCKNLLRRSLTDNTEVRENCTLNVSHPTKFCRSTENNLLICFQSWIILFEYLRQSIKFKVTLKNINYRIIKLEEIGEVVI